MIRFIHQNSLERISPHTDKFGEPYESTYALCREWVAYQLAITGTCSNSVPVEYEFITDTSTHVYVEKSVIINWPHYEYNTFEGYCLDSPGIMPDILVPLDQSGTIRINLTTTVLWVEFYAVRPGDMEHKIEFTMPDGQKKVATFTAHVLPNGMDYYTPGSVQFIDPMSIAASYKVPVFSNVFWDMLDKYMSMAKDCGVTGLVVPLFSPRYDVKMHFEPVQLVKITKEKESYKFNFDLLDSWLLLMKRNEIKKIVIPPLFPSFADKKCPELYHEDFYDSYPVFEEDELFTSEKYLTFIKKLIRSFRKHVKEFDYDFSLEFQVSSRARFKDIEEYSKCRKEVYDLFGKNNVVDVFPTWDFFRRGDSSSAVIFLYDYDKFSHDVLSCGRVSTDIDDARGPINQQIATPMERLRAVGPFSFCYHIREWFNLYANHAYSLEGNPVDIMVDPESGGSYPAGAAYLFYPGVDGPLPSIRLKQFKLALEDYRLVATLENLMSYKRICDFIEKELKMTSGSITTTPERYMNFRRKVYQFYEKYNSKMNKENK